MDMKMPSEELSPPDNERRLAFGAGAVGAVNVAKLCLQLLMLPLMARLLGPAEFGLYALALPAVSFVTMLADGGLGLSLSREPESSSVWSTAFWLLFGVGVLLAGVLTSWGLLLGHVMHQPRLPGLMALLSCSLILMTLSVCPAARLMRRGSLGVGAGAELAANFTGALVGALLAFRGAGAISLAAQYVAVYGVRAIVINLAAFHRPAFEFYPMLLRDHFSTGGFVIAVRASDFAGRMLESVIFTGFLGTTSFGRYMFANQVSRFVCESAGNPIWAALYVKGLHNTRSEVAAIQVQLCRLLGLFLCLAGCLLAACAPLMIALLLGPKWSSAAPVLSILILGFVFNAIASQSGPILLAHRRYDIQFYCTAGLAVGRILAICAAPWWGLLGVACFVTVANCLYAAAMLIVPADITGCQPVRLIKALLGPLFAAIFSGFVCWGTIRCFNDSWSVLGTAIILGCFAYCVILLTVDRARILGDITAVQNLLSKSSKFVTK